MNSAIKRLLTAPGSYLSLHVLPLKVALKQFNVNEVHTREEDAFVAILMDYRYLDAVSECLHKEHLEGFVKRLNPYTANADLWYPVGVGKSPTDALNRMDNRIGDVSLLFSVNDYMKLIQSANASMTETMLSEWRNVSLQDFTNATRLMEVLRRTNSKSSLSRLTTSGIPGHP